MTQTALKMDEIGTHGVSHQIRARKPEAWDILYREIGERVFRLLYRMTGDRDTALDLTQETFLKVAQKGDRFDGRGSLHGWVFRIAANLARERYRRERMRRLRMLEFSGHQTQPVDARDTELKVVLEAAVSALSEKLRRVLLLHDVDGYTHTQIAEMLNIPEGSSKARLSRARARLRDLLKGAL